MRNLKFKSAKAENFLCFGEEGISINFESYGNIVCIKGKNLDVNNEDGSIASNGSGKSSIPEIIVYALYGKTIKKPKKLAHAHIINNKSGHPLRVELLWDDYRLVRTRDVANKGTLRLWRSDKAEWNKKTEITGSGIPATQKDIEKIVGLTYESFINIFIFSDDNTLPFLECDGPTKREIVENLLSLEKYRHYSQNAKDLLKVIKDKIKDLTREYDNLNAQKDSATNHISQIEKQERDWYDARKREMDFLLLEIKQKRDALEKSNAGEALAAYQEAQEQIVALKATLPVLETNKTTYNDYVATITSKISKQDDNIDKYNIQLKLSKTEHLKYEKIVNDNRKIVNDVENKSGKSCPYCLNVVDKKQFIEIFDKANDILNVNLPAFEKAKEDYELAETTYNNAITVKRNLEKGLVDVKNRLSKVNAEISGIHCEIVDLSKIEKPNADIAELLLCEQIESLKKQANDKQEQLKSLTPFEDIKQTALADLVQKVKECSDKKEEIKKSENELPYYDFWVKAFGDSGIRKYIIDGIIPTLNDRVEYWLQYLIDNKIKLTFNNELDETIDRYPFNGRPYVYHGMSGGQRRRLNLTVAAAWAFISALNSGASPSVIFLDEVTMNMDVVGVQGIFRMICELAKEKQVFVIDHNENLLQMLDGCDTINLEMQDEISNKVVDTLATN